MADRGHVLTDKRLRDIERRMAEEYEQATEEMREKLIRFLNQFQAQDNVQRKLLEAGKITAKDYADWRYRHIMMNKRWAEMSATLAADYHNVNQIVAGIYRGERGDIYALNHNFAVYQMEHDGLMDTGLTLYDKDSVNRILQKNPQMLPPPGKKVSERIAAGVDVRWNNQQIQSAMLQGILQGDTIPELARRLEQVTERNYTAAVRNARTMATGAQNAGRLEAYKRATNLGVDLVEEWQATLDMRTRHDHRLMHGKRINVGEKWETPQGELKFPGDPDGPPGEVYNCRCTTLSYVKGFEKDTIKSSPKMGDLSFEEWQKDKRSFMSNSAGEILEEPKPGKLISQTDLEAFAADAQKRGYFFATDVSGVRDTIYGGFEHFQGDKEELAQILDELDASRELWPDKVKEKGIILGYRSFGNLDDFAESFGRTIVFNKDIYDDAAFLANAYAVAVENGTFVKETTPASVPWHEIGHVIQRNNRTIYRRMIGMLSVKGDIEEIGLKLTSRYGITIRDGEYKELLPEILSATRSEDSGVRNSALEFLRRLIR